MMMTMISPRLSLSLILSLKGGLEMVTLKSGTSTAEVYLFGGVVTSFTKSGRDVLYVRPDAKFDKSKPISGGVPHCWPQFGPGEIQVHGFARNVDWTLVSSGEDTMTMKLTPNEYTKAMWDKEFEVVETVSIKDDALTCELAVTNKGSEPFTFTGSFHTYFAADIDAVQVKGLEGCESFDRLKEESGKVSAPITCKGPIDSLYKNAPSQIDLDVGGGNSVKITGAGWKDAVVWTPWTDMEACYKEFVCVENASCAEPVTVAPGATWTASTKLE
jgi:glucose-6-phosphate 1-epimerase